MSEKQLLIESCNFSFDIKDDGLLTEALKLEDNGSALIVRNFPSTCCDLKNLNGRIYPTKLMEQAIKEAKPRMERRELNSQSREHPQSTDVTPTDISHTVINAYIKNVEIERDGKKQRCNVLFTDWLVVPTPDGKTLMTLLKSGISVPVSIRGLGSCDANGVVEDYELKGVDCVGTPSSQVHSTMHISESVEVSAAPMNEAFVVSASSTNVVRDLHQAVMLQQQINDAKYGTINKTSTKLDSEIDPKTGAETTMVTLEAETEDKVSDLDQALAMAKAAMLNGTADIDSVTIENVKEEQPKESVENSDVPLNEDDKDPTYQALKNSGYYRFDTPEEYMKFINDNVEYLGDYTLADAEEIFAKYEDGRIDPKLACHEFEGFVDAITHNRPFELHEDDAKDSKEDLYMKHIADHAGKMTIKQIKEFNRLCDRVKEGVNDVEDLKVFAASCGIPALDDDEERYGTCTWCGDVFPLSDLKKEKHLGYLCNHCAKGIESREGKLSWEDMYVPESKMTEAFEVESNPYVLLGKICKNSNEDSWIQKKARELANGFEHGDIDYSTFAVRLNDLTNINDFNMSESVIAEDKDSQYNVHEFNAKGADKVYDSILGLMWNNGMNLEQACRAYSEMHNDVIPYEYLVKYMTPSVKKESINEAKEEDPKAGRKFVLKCPAGFVAMDGNALVFKDSPKEALHFIVGKEESGLVHLSGVEKILDTMGVYDVEKYYRKDTTDISAPDGIANNETPTEDTEDSTEVKEEQKEGLISGDGGVIPTKNCNNTAIKEDNGSNTRFEATVEIQGQNGNSSETIPVSAVDMEGINAEVENLYNMKSQKAEGPVTIRVTDTSNGDQFVFNPESRQVEPVQAELQPVEQPVEPQQESAGDLELDGNKLSMEVDDDNTIEKEFKTPVQAAVAKAGIESGKLGGDVLMSEDQAITPNYEDIKPGWYATIKGNINYGLLGPYDSKEELMSGMEDKADQLEIGYVTPDMLEAAKMDEVIFTSPSEASDPMIDKPLEDAVAESEASNDVVVVEVKDIDWNNKDFVNKFMSDLNPGDNVNSVNIMSRIRDLPDNTYVKLKVSEMPEHIDYNVLKDCVKDKLAKTYGMGIEDLDIVRFDSIN